MHWGAGSGWREFYPIAQKCVIFGYDRDKREFFGGGLLPSER